MLDTDVAQDADAHDVEFADSRSQLDEDDRLDMFDVTLSSHDKLLHHLNLAVQTLGNKVAYILGQPLPNQGRLHAWGVLPREGQPWREPAHQVCHRFPWAIGCPGF